jgi:phosphatidylserine/phosphatidylglycerophosphate/cardiolipin synthase-like enzyme
MPPMITVRTLTDGGQQPLDIASELSDFIAEARATIELALYDLNLSPPLADVVTSAITGATARGVAVRLVYNVDHRGPIPVPPPPRTDPTLIERLRIASRPVPGVPDLMHHKYVVRDGKAVWTGSTNWTDDSWSREENVIVTVGSPALAARFLQDFEQLWTTGTVESSGEVPPDPIRVDETRIRAWFCPGEGTELAHHIAKRLGHARRRIRIASPVISSGPILGTLAEIASDAKVDLAAVVDQTQIEEVLHQWHENGTVGWKIAALEHLLAAAPISGKRSTPWGPSTVHDFMHAKVTVADDIVFVGSYNLSHSGERNAENVLEIEDPELAERLAGFVDEVRARYPASTLPSNAPS